MSLRPSRSNTHESFCLRSKGLPGEEKISVCDALSHLHDMEASFSNIVEYLTTKVNNIHAHVPRETTFAILEPLKGSAGNFIAPVANAWINASGIVDYFARCLHPPPGRARYQSVRQNTQMARDALPLLDATIVRIETPLTAQIQRLINQESHFLKWPSPELVDLLDDLPQLLSALRYYCCLTMQYLNVIENFIVCLDDFFSDERRGREFGRRPEFVRGLSTLAGIMEKSHWLVWRHSGVLCGKSDRAWIRQSYLYRDQFESEIRAERLQLLLCVFVLALIFLGVYIICK